MRFSIKQLSAEAPELQLGPRGSELECFIPAGINWKQLNYGQGEGQVEIDGCEWGFYRGADDEVSVVLHGGSVHADAALAFVRDVSFKVFGTKACVVQLVGSEA